MISRESSKYGVDCVIGHLYGGDGVCGGSGVGDGDDFLPN